LPQGGDQQRSDLVTPGPERFLLRRRRLSSARHCRSRSFACGPSAVPPQTAQTGCREATTSERSEAMRADRLAGSGSLGLQCLKVALAPSCDATGAFRTELAASVDIPFFSAPRNFLFSVGRRVRNGARVLA